MSLKTYRWAGAVLASALAASAISPAAAEEEPDGEALVNALNGVFGDHKMRASHAKGHCVTGSFTPAEEAPSLSEAAIFFAPSSVIGRFSIGGGNPKAADAAKGARGLALRFSAGDGESIDFVTISVPVFFARTPAQVVGFLEARIPGQDGKPDPEKIKAFADANPETTHQGAWIASHPVPASYASTNYWAIHAFTLTNAEGNETTVKLKFVPKDGEVGLTDEEAASKASDFYTEELKARLAAGPAEFELVAIVGEDSDPTDDPTARWPEEERQSVSLGTLEIGALEDEATCDATMFDPTNLPKGIAGPDKDQIFPARTPAYAVSFSRRAD